jgi:gingipain R
MKNRTPVLLALLLAGCASIDTNAPSTTDALNLGQKVWVPLSSATPVAPKVTMSGGDLVFSLGGYYVESAHLDGQNYVRISVPENSELSEAGMPELPKVRVNVALAPSSVPAIKVVSEKSKQVAIDPPLPSRGDITRDMNPDTIPYVAGPLYQNGGKFPAQSVEMGSAFALRQVEGVPVQFQPFQYDASAKSLRVSSEIRVHVTGATTGRQAAPKSEEFSAMYDGAFRGIESNIESYPEVAEPGRLLVITADAYAGAIEPLVDWKIRRGLTTTVKKMSEIGTTADAVQAAIKAEYASPNSVTYVLLVGDADSVPTLRGGRERAACDACYAMVQGTDYYPDLYISRISGRTVEQIETQVAKFVTYERSPDVEGAWYNVEAGIASAEGSPKDWQRHEDIRNALESYGYTSSVKIYDPGAKAAQVKTAVESGVGLINYIGHGSGTSWGTSAFNVSNVQSLQNTGKWPFIIDVACQNGSFVSLEPSFAEAWLRAGTKDAPKGAIGMYAASTNASWVPPTVMQAWATNELLIKEKRNTLGSLSFGGAARVLETYPGSEGQKLVEQYNLFGDATIVLRTKKPKALTVTQSAASSGTAVTVTWADGTPARGATVAISNGSVVAVGVTDEAGATTLAHTERDRGSALTVTAYNAIPFEGTVQQ